MSFFTSFPPLPLTNAEIRATPLPVEVTGGEINIENASLTVDLSAFLPIPDSVLAVGTFDGTEDGLKAVMRVDGDGYVGVNGSHFTQPISALELPLPEDAATDTLQTAGNLSLASIDSKLSGSLTVTGPLTDTQLRASAVPISAAALPLPAGAASETTLAALNVKVTAVDTGAVVVASSALPNGAATAALQTQPGVDIGDVTVNNAAGAAAVNIQDGGNSITIDGSLTLLAGSAIVGKVGIDQTTPGVTNGVQINAALPAGSNAIGKLAANTGVTIGAVEIAASQTLATVTTVGAVTAITNALPAGNNNIGDVDVATLPALVAGSAIIGKVGIDQTTPGTTNGVQINAALPAGSNAIGILAAFTGVTIGAVEIAAAQTLATVTTVGAVTAITNALPAGSNAIGKLAANSGVDIGDVDVTSLPALIAGSAIIGKVGIDQTTPGTTNGVQINAALPAGSNAIGKLAANTGVTIGAVEIAAAQTLSTVTTVGTVSAITAVPTDTDKSTTGNLTALNDAATLTTNGVSTVGIQITGTWSGTLVFEATNDTSTWFAKNALPHSGAGAVATSTTGNTQLLVNTAGCAQFRVRRSVATSGTAVVTLTGSSAAGIVTATTGNINNLLVAAGQTGTWTVQPGNTANTTAWLTRPVDSANADLTTTIGTQASRAIAIQQQHDAGRTELRFCAVAAAAGSTGVETAITLTKSSGVASTTTATSFVITSGKRFRITNISVATRGNATATIQTTTFNLRVNTAGAVTTSSTPIVMSLRSATAAVASDWDRVMMTFPEGWEILGDGTLQFGITAAATYTTNAPTWDVCITGYEY